LLVGEETEQSEEVMAFAAGGVRAGPEAVRGVVVWW